VDVERCSTAVPRFRIEEDIGGHWEFEGDHLEGSYLADGIMVSFTDALETRNRSVS
jgi:hypothetical protein